MLWNQSFIGPLFSIRRTLNMHSSSRRRENLDTSNGSAYSLDSLVIPTTRSARSLFDGLLVPHVLKHPRSQGLFSYTNFRHWSIGYQLRGGITHKHSDITRVVTAMDSWSHWHCLICFRLELCHADSLFQVLRYWGMTRKCNEHAKM